MTNASVRNSFVTFSVFVIGAVLSMGAFATVVHADLGYYDSYGDNLGYYDSYGSNLGYYDSYGSNLGYYDSYGSNLGYYDSYGDNLGYYDSYGDNLGYYDSYGSNLGYYDSYGDNLGYYDSYGSNSYTPTYNYSYPSYSYGGVGYSYSPFYTSGGCGNSCGGSSGGGGFNFGTGRTCGGTCGGSSYSAPIQNTTTNNHCTGNSCNTTVTTIDNSINGSFNTNTTTVTPVYQAPITYPVQYVYPTYTQPTYTYQQQPYCTITISGNTSGNYGNYSNQLATLSWSSSNATSAFISPSVGSVATFGSRTVYPVGNQIYTMTVYGTGGSATCQTTSYYAPINPQVALTQIPYTGLDLGIMGNALYWLSILSFAAAGAYLLVYYKGGMLTLATAAIGRASSSAAAVPMKVIEATAKKIDAAIEPVFASFTKASESTNAMSTSDSMTLVPSKEGTAPRIVISRN